MRPERSEWSGYEEDVSTEQPTAAQEARVQVAHGEPCGTARVGGAAAQGTEASRRLSVTGRVEGLRRRREFRQVYERGAKVPGRFMVVFALPSDGESRLGVTATRRIGGAVTRNRARRRVRALARLEAAAVTRLRSDVVVNVRSALVEASWDDLRADFSACLGRLERRLALREP